MTMTRSPLNVRLAARFLRAGLGALLITAGLGASRASAQSFNCRNAHYPDEKTICREPALGQLDQDLASAYSRVMQKLPRAERDAFDKNEDTFVTARRRCGEQRACIEQSYRNRIKELQDALPEGESRSSRDSASAKRGKRRDAPSEEHQSSEDRPAASGEIPPGAPETAIHPAEREGEQSEPRSATLKAPPEARPRAKAAKPPSQEEPEAPIAGAKGPEKRNRSRAAAEFGSADPGLSPEHEKPPASGSSTAAGRPAKAPEKRHAKATAAASDTPASPETPPAPTRTPTASGAPTTAQAAAHPKSTHPPTIEWVNPTPSR